jgi:hypothetical protein
VSTSIISSSDPYLLQVADHGQRLRGGRRRAQWLHARGSQCVAEQLREDQVVVDDKDPRGGHRLVEQ